MPESCNAGDRARAAPAEAARPAACVRLGKPAGVCGAPDARSRRRQAAGELAGLFGLPAGEEVLESFACALVQTYGCQHNALTPPREARRRRARRSLVAGCTAIAAGPHHTGWRRAQEVCWELVELKGAQRVSQRRGRIACGREPAARRAWRGLRRHAGAGRYPTEACTRHELCSTVSRAGLPGTCILSHVRPGGLERRAGVRTARCRCGAAAAAQVAFAGKLYVTGRRACFHAPAERVAFALAHDDLRAVAKLPAAPGAKAGARPSPAAPLPNCLGGALGSFAPHADVGPAPRAPCPWVVHGAEVCVRQCPDVALLRTTEGRAECPATTGAQLCVRQGASGSPGSG